MNRELNFFFFKPKWKTLLSYSKEWINLENEYEELITGIKEKKPAVKKKESSEIFNKESESKESIGEIKQ